MLIENKFKMTDQIHAIAVTFKAMSNEHRIKILILLAEGEQSVSDIEKHIGLRQSSISQQLAQLRSAKIVSAERRGKKVYYSIKDKNYFEIIKFIQNKLLISK